MSDELVTIAEYETVYEAQVVSDELEANSIKSMVVGEDLKMVSPLVGPSTIEVKVFQADVEKAQAVIKDMESQADDSSEEI